MWRFVMGNVSVLLVVVVVVVAVGRRRRRHHRMKKGVNQLERAATIAAYRGSAPAQMPPRR